jgi:hypothetical protein
MDSGTRMTPRRFIPAVCLVALCLGACASPEELQRADAAQCASYGFTPGTPDFAACLQRESLARRGTSGVSVGFGFSGGF